MMTDAAATPPRRERDTLLAALELFQELAIPRSLTSLVLFLYVCENEGLIVSELADVSGVTVPIAARLSKILAGQLSEFAVRPEARLFELRSSRVDKRLRHIYLTVHGRRIRDQLDALIVKATPIQGSTAPGDPPSATREEAA